MAESDDDMPAPRNNALAKPDPSTLTVAMLVREIAALEKIIDTRLSGMDRAIVLVNDGLIRERTETEKRIKHLQELTSERFSSVENRFVERDVREERAARDNKISIDAALQAAKEAASEQNKSITLSIDKSGTATTKQIDGLENTLRTAVSGIDTIIADVKERVTRIESMGLGRTAAGVEQRAVTTDNRASVAQVLGIVGAGISVVLFLLAIAAFIIANTGGT